MKLDSKVFQADEFLAQYWQRRPCLLRGGFAQFEDLIEPEILAGLAMEEDADSRVVRRAVNADNSTSWQVEHGPFSDYEAFGDSHWTLLVQSVNEWLPAVGQLLTAFDFLPQWRIDDVMVSFSCAEGGVGPHLDQYDVFIIQGAGRRRWQVGERQNMTNYQPCADLTLVKEPFTAVIDAELEPGDVLYIPAGCPHDGIALEPSLNYSVGFRAPSQAEWLQQLGDLALQQDVLNQRYQDPDLRSRKSSYQVSDNELQQCKALLMQTLESGQLDDLLLRLMSQSKRTLVEPDLPYTAQQIDDLLAQPQALLVRSAGARWLYHQPQQAFYGNGERYLVSPQSQPLAHKLAQQTEHPGADLLTQVNTGNDRELLAELLNQGLFQLFLDTD